MNRILKTLFLTASLLIALFAANAFAGGEATTENVGILERSSQCRTAPMSLFRQENVFITASNTVSFGGFEGCWSYWPSGPCRAIYRNGNSYKICGTCDSNGNPGSGPCGSISSSTLNSGYWCS